MTETSNQSRQFFTGNTLEQAVLAGAKHFGLEPDELAYERVERRGGFMRGRRSVVIKVDASKPRREGGAVETAPAAAEPPPSSAAPIEPSRPEPVAVVEPPEVAAPTPVVRVAEENPAPASPEPSMAPSPAVSGPASDEMVAAVRRGVELLGRLGELKVSAKVAQGDGQLEVDLEGEDAALLIRGEGRLLMAFQQLLPRVLQGITGELQPCRVDSGGFRQDRVVALEKQARQAAEEVLNSGEPKTLGSMSPADRRTVHLAVEELAGVTTESQGHGFYKKITVRPS